MKIILGKKFKPTPDPSLDKEGNVKLIA